MSEIGKDELIMQQLSRVGRVLSLGKIDGSLNAAYDAIKRIRYTIDETHVPLDDTELKILQRIEHDLFLLMRSVGRMAESKADEIVEELTEGDE